MPKVNEWGQPAKPKKGVVPPIRQPPVPQVQPTRPIYTPPTGVGTTLTGGRVAALGTVDVGAIVERLGLSGRPGWQVEQRLGGVSPVQIPIGTFVRRGTEPGFLSQQEMRALYQPATAAAMTGQIRTEAAGYRPATWGRGESVRITHPGIRVPGPEQPRGQGRYVTPQPWSQASLTGNQIDIWAARYTGQALAEGHRPGSVSPGVARHLQVAGQTIDQTMQGFGYFMGADGNWHATQAVPGGGGYGGGDGGGGGGYGGGGGGYGRYSQGQGLVNWRIGY